MNRYELIFNRVSGAYYNKSDIVRINEHIEYLINLFNLDLVVNDVDFDDYFTYNVIENILYNISELRKSYYIATDTPITPNHLNFDFNKANNLEKILFDLEQFYFSVNNDIIYSGEIISGGNRL